MEENPEEDSSLGQLFYQHVISQSDLGSSQNNDLNSEVEQLLLKNAAQFGQRLTEQSGDASAGENLESLIPSYHKARENDTSGDAPDVIVTRNDPSYNPPVVSYVTRDGRHYETIKSSYPNKPALVVSYRVDKTTTTTTPAPETDDSEVSPSLNHEFLKRLRSHYLASRGGDTKAGNSILYSYNSDDSHLDKVGHKFYRPIVVSDDDEDEEYDKGKPYQYSTTFECDDEDDHWSSTPDPVFEYNKAYIKDHSPSIVSPEQVLAQGAALLKAGKLKLLDALNAHHVKSVEKDPAPIVEHHDEPPPEDKRHNATLQLMSQYALGQVRVLGFINDQKNQELAQQAQAQPAQHQAQASADKPSNDEIVEILKSIEIYQSSPGQEMFYIPAIEVPQAQQTVAQEQPAEVQTVQEQPAVEQAAVEQSAAEQPAAEQQQEAEVIQKSENFEVQKAEVVEQQSEIKTEPSKQESSDDGKSHPTEEKKSEAAGEQAASNSEASSHQPVYVVTPTTYELDDSSDFKSNLLLEKVQEFHAKKAQEQGNFNEFYAYKSADENEHSENAAAASETVNRQARPETPVVESEVVHGQVPDKEIEKTSAASVTVHRRVRPEKALEKKTVEKKVVDSLAAEKKRPSFEVDKPVEDKWQKHTFHPSEEIVKTKLSAPIIVPPITIKTQPTPQFHVDEFTEKLRKPISVHVPHPQAPKDPYNVPIPIDKIIEKAVNIPFPLEKILEKKPYPLEVEKLLDRNSPLPLELAKLFEKPVAHTPYGGNLGLSLQQLANSKNAQGLYSQLGALIRAHASNGYKLPTSISAKISPEISLNRSNFSQAYNPAPISYNYQGSIPSYGSGEPLAPKKRIPFLSSPPSYSVSNTLRHNRRHATLSHRSSDGYIGPVPPIHPIQRQFGFQSKSSFPVYPARKPRNHEPPVRYQKGNFRQSKIEYGFKPPMVPSVQYDEETASKVES